MREPAPIFCDALKAYPWHMLKRPWERGLAQEMLARWIDHKECESIWVTVELSLKVKVTPDHFIAEIIITRLDAETLDRIKTSDFIARMSKLSNRLLRGEQLAEWDDRGAAFANTFPVFKDARVRVQRAGLIRRKATARMYFMRQLSEGFQRWCRDNRPLDDVVRLLTDIAFNCETTTEAVRAARDRAIRSSKN